MDSLHNNEETKVMIKSEYTDDLRANISWTEFGYFSDIEGPMDNKIQLGNLG